MYCTYIAGGFSVFFTLVLLYFLFERTALSQAGDVLYFVTRGQIRLDTGACIDSKFTVVRPFKLLNKAKKKL